MTDASEPPDAAADAGMDAAMSDAGDSGIDAAEPPACAVDNGGCDDVCIQQDDALSCECLSGRELDDDGRTCRGWYPVHDFPERSYTAEGPSVALDPSGIAVAAWYFNEIGVQVARFDGNTWGTPITVSSKDSDLLQTATSRNGDVFVAWGRAGMEVARISRNGRVRDRIELPSEIDLAADGLGNAFIMSGPSVRRHTAGEEGWSEPTMIGGSGPTTGRGRIEMDAAGNAVAVWQGAGAAWANRYVAGSGWSDATELGAMGNGALQLALDGAGGAWVAWTSEGLWVSRYSQDSGWSEATLIEGATPVPTKAPQLAADAAGNLDLLWSQQVGSVMHESWTSHYDATTGWEGPILLADHEGIIAVDSSGSAMFLWTGGNLTARRRVEGSWGMPFETIWFQSPPSRLLQSYDLAANNTGRGFLVGWRELYLGPEPLVDEHHGVHVRLYD